MSAGEVAGLIAAVAFVLLVGLLAVPLLKLGRTIDELTRTVRLIREEPVARTARTVDETNELLAGVNEQVRKVDALTDDATTVTGNVAALSNVVATSVGRPLVKVSAFSYAVRTALSAETREGMRRAAQDGVRDRSRRPPRTGRTTGREVVR